MKRHLFVAGHVTCPVRSSTLDSCFHGPSARLARDDKQQVGLRACNNLCMGSLHGLAGLVGLSQLGAACSAVRSSTLGRGAGSEASQSCVPVRFAHRPQLAAHSHQSAVPCPMPVLPIVTSATLMQANVMLSMTLHWIFRGVGVQQGQTRRLACCHFGRVVPARLLLPMPLAHILLSSAATSARIGHSRLVKTAP